MSAAPELQDGAGSSATEPQGHCAEAAAMIFLTSGTRTPKVGITDFMYA